MNSTGRVEVFGRVKQLGIIPAMRAPHSAQAVRACTAIRAGGLPIVEISMACECSLQVLEAVVKAHGKDMLVGAGSVLNAEAVERAAGAGAQFIVTPGFDQQAVEKAIQLDVAVFAGALTPTEVQIASNSGADAVKLFPCYSVGGPRYVRALRGQYPKTDFIASGGVGLDNCADYVRAGICALGVGGDIVDAESMAAGDHRLFTVRAKRFRDALANARALWEPWRSLKVGEAG